MRPYNIRNLIVVASVSATITVLVLKSSGYLHLRSYNSNSQDMPLTTIVANKEQPFILPTGKSAITLTCLNGYALLQTSSNPATTHILADQHSLPVKCH
jgi:hypothetical protein